MTYHGHLGLLGSHGWGPLGGHLGLLGSHGWGPLGDLYGSQHSGLSNFN